MEGGRQDKGLLLSSLELLAAAYLRVCSRLRASDELVALCLLEEFRDRAG